MRRLAACTALIGLILGVFGYVAAYWLAWDWINSIVNWYVDWPRFCAEWEFYAPLFIHRWTCETWTGPFDVSLLLSGISVGVIAASSFTLGWIAGRGRRHA